MSLQLTLTRTLPLDLERQDLFAAAVVEEILHGLRAEQLANHFACLSHQWAQWAAGRVGTAARFAWAFQGARQWSDRSVDKLDDVQNDDVRGSFAKRITPS